MSSSEYIKDLVGPVDVTPRVETGTRYDNATEIKDKVLGVTINSKLGTLDISKKKEEMSNITGTDKVSSSGVHYTKDFESGFGAEAGITKRSSEAFGPSTEKRFVARYKKTFKSGGEVEVGKGKDYIKDLI